jgi:hypothetical protein
LCCCNLLAVCAGADVWGAGSRGLDNAGKTTILKKFMGQDITEISPTLGFDIQTLEYKECVDNAACFFNAATRETYGLLCDFPSGLS